MGAPGNELADQEAKAGANKDYAAFALPPEDSLKGSSKTAFSTYGMRSGEPTPQAKETKQFFPGPNATLSRAIRVLSRVSLGL